MHAPGENPVNPLNLAHAPAAPSPAPAATPTLPSSVRGAGPRASPPAPARNTYAPPRIVVILQTLITALALAIIFRAFLVEPFIIPTGSMADTLLGMHANQTCPACGWEFSFAPAREGGPPDVFVCPPDVTCPNCQTRLETDPARTAPRPGDRILVHMWPYAIGGPFGPHRWDVVVFRDPVDPTQHYIKRLVGLPGESVELLDGDLFINGCIQRKPPWVQSVLWFIVYDQAHLPAAGTAVGELPRWIPRDPPSAGAVGWTGVDTRVIRYDGLDQTFRRLAFNADTNREYLSDFYAYDRRSSGTFVGDVRLVTDLTFDAGDDGLCEFEIIRPPHRYIAEVRPHGLATLRIESAAGRAQQARGPVQFQPPPQGQPFHVEFGHVDCRVYLKIAGREVLAEEYAPEVERLRLDPGTRPVNLQIAACNVRLSLASLRIDRDVHYTAPLPQTRRAAAGAPFTLRADEHFMLGDNSPDSHDSREWAEAGPHMPSGYRPGTVLRNQIVGQAAFVYLPGLLPVDPAGRWHVPDLGRARFVR